MYGVIHWFNWIEANVPRMKRAGKVRGNLFHCQANMKKMAAESELNVFYYSVFFSMFRSKVVISTFLIH